MEKENIEGESKKMRIIQHSLNKVGLYYGVGDLFYSKEGITIVDNEICNDISPDWIYENGLPIVVGFLNYDMIKIFVAESDNDKEFEKTVCDYLNKYSSVSQLFAFNKFMEMGNFKGAFGYNLEINEIKPFNAKGWNKEKFFQTLIDKAVIPFVKIEDPFKGDSGLCIKSWGKYIITGNSKHLMDIVKHNINCLLKESIILKNRQYFLDNYKINSRGWLDE